MLRAEGDGARVIGNFARVRDGEFWEIKVRREEEVGPEKDKNVIWSRHLVGPLN